MWTPPKIWENGECWIIGGGPSITEQFGVPKDLVQSVREKQTSISSYSPFLSFLHDKHVIAINMAFKLGDWVDFIFYGDNGFFLKNKKELIHHPKIKIACSDKPPEHASSYGVRYMPLNRRKPKGISEKYGQVSWNGNSGAASISLAYQLGACKIYLLGFDMSLDSLNYQHWHGEYSTVKNKDKRAADPRKLPFNRHLSGFPQIAKDAKRLGLEIINVNPSSAIDVFPKKSLKEILNEKEKRQAFGRVD